MSDPSSPHPRSAPPSKAGAPLDGEVIPPRIRVVNPEPAAPQSVPDTRNSGAWRVSTLVLTAALVATLSGAGALEGYRWHLHRLHAAAAGPSQTTVALARLSKDVGELKMSVTTARPDDATKALKKSVDQLRADLDGLRTANTAAVAQLTARLDVKTAAPAIADVVARLDKLDHDPKFADITSRLDRIEHQVSSPLPTGSIVPQTRVSAGQSVVSQDSVAAPSKPVKTAVLDTYVLRDVYSGIALVEGRTGSVREVVPGESLPGAGEVRSIERRGRTWVVVTSRGIINTETW